MEEEEENDSDADGDDDDDGMTGNLLRIMPNS